MKNKLALCFFTLLTAGSACYSQKKNQTSAAITFNDFQQAMVNGDSARAKNDLDNAKNFIQLDLEHPETKDEDRTQFLKGRIYFNAAYYDTPPFNKSESAWLLHESVVSYDKAFKLSDKYDDVIETEVNLSIALLHQEANRLFQATSYDKAFLFFDMSSRFSAAINKIDTAALYNAAMCATYLSNWESAVNYFTKSKNYGYSSPELPKMLSQVQYQYAAALVSKGSDLIEKAQKLTPSDALYKNMFQEATNYYKKAADVCETYLQTNPNDKEVLKVLVKIYPMLSMPEKTKEYQQRLAALE